MRRFIQGTSFLLFLATAARVTAVGVGDTLPDFRIPKWNATETLRREDFASQVVVIDFFAYWCVPCRTASTRIEREIQEHYSRRGGNARGAPVRVVSVNIEPDFPAKTDEFIRATGASLVLNGSDERLIENFGVQGIPLLLVVDGTVTGEGGPSWKVVYRSEGLEGIGPLRAAIDAIGPASDQRTTSVTASTDKPAAVAPGEKDASFVAEHSSDLDFEGLFASDIALTDSSVGYKLTHRRAEIRLSASLTTIDLRYQPDNRSGGTDPTGVARDLSDRRWGVQGSAKVPIHPRLSLLGSGGVYDGYASYREFWLNEYYRQQFGSLSGPGRYRNPEPGGYSVAGGFRWEYWPTLGFVEATGSFLKDDVAPGYELEFDPGPPPRSVLSSGSSTLYTTAARVAFENVVTSRLRSLLEFRWNDTTDRAARFGGQVSLNWAVTEHITVRPYVSYAIEAPQFEAWIGGASIERDWDNRWFAGLFGRYYTDSGYVVNPGFITSASPPLESFQFGPSLRWRGDRAGLKIQAGPYFTRYGNTGDGTAPYRNLYRDRDWVLVQAAFNLQF